MVWVAVGDSNTAVHVSSAHPDVGDSGRGVRPIWWYKALYKHHHVSVLVIQWYFIPHFTLVHMENYLNVLFFSIS